MPILATAKRSYEPLPSGEYEFLVEEATRSRSKNNNPMFKITLSTEFNGFKKKVFDYIVFIEECSPKITEYVQSVGINVKEGDSLKEEWVESSRGKTLKARVKIEDDPKYGEQNRIAYYIEADKKTNKPTVDDPNEIPF